MNFGDRLTRPIEGIQAATTRIDRYAEAIASGRFDVHDLVGVMESKRNVEIQVATIRASDEISESLLDVLA